MTRIQGELKTYALRKDMRRRSAIEPIIGHMKSDGLLGRNYLRGTIGASMLFVNLMQLYVRAKL